MISLGDVECPERLDLVYGIPGEADVPSVARYLRALERPEDFRVIVFHFPPYGFPCFGKKCGDRRVLSFILAEKPELVIHGHSEDQLEYRIGDTRVVSVGSLERGFYVIYDPRRNSYSLERLGH